ncbi:MAG TPA: HDOD domain-containing protein, partial [Candidatus Hydrogenedentes bacterium]|nr:HDOD domain-containing protein [Candidatus Hydrogenedentota bacterium]
MPKSVAGVLETVQRHGISLSEVAEALEQDPALCAKVLRVSNSAYFGMKRQVSTIKLAVVVLGLREIRDIAMGIALFDA